jgi:hypothetical protein
MKLGKNQSAIFILFGLATTFFYYANKTINHSQGTFSDGIFAGFFLGLTFICSLCIMFLFGRMLYLNFKVRVKKGELK